MIKRWLVLVIVFIISLAILSGLDRYYCMKEYERYDLNLERFAEHFQADLRATVVAHLHAVEDLKAFALARGKLLGREEFERYAAQSLRNYPAINYMGYVDNTNSTRYYYPIQGNEELIGVDISTFPFYSPATAKVIQEIATTVNPIPGVRNTPGRFITARTPLYLEEEYAGVAVIGFEVTAMMRDVLNRVAEFCPSGNQCYYVAVSVPGQDVFWQFNQLATDTGLRSIPVQVADTQWIVQIGWNHVPQPAAYARWLGA